MFRASKMYCCKSVSPNETNSVKNVVKVIVGALVARHLFSKPILLLTAALGVLRASHNAPFFLTKKKVKIED